jgi:alanine dehydrogenase
VAGRTATHAFVNSAMPFIMEVAQKGVTNAIAENAALESAVNTRDGQMYHLSRLTVNKEAEDGND